MPAAPATEFDAKGNPIRSVSRTLTAERRNKLLALQRREQMKDVLIEKFKKSNSNCSEKVISNEVTNFVKKAKVTEANLNRLERRIKHRADNDEGDCGSDFEGNDEEIPEDIVSCYSCPSVASTRLSNISGLSKLSHCTSLSALLAQGKVPQDYEWSRLDEYAQFLAGQDQARTKNIDKDVKAKLRNQLDKQVVERQNQKQQLVEDEKKYYDNLLIELDEWKIQEKEKEEEFHKKMQQEKASRDEQFFAEQKKKAEEKEKIRLEEERIVKQVVEEIAADRKAQEKKKEKEKKAILKVFKENMKEKREREALADEARGKDLEEQKNNIKLMEEQAAQRASESAERDARQKEMIDKMKEQVFAQQAAAGKEDAIRARAQQDEAENRACTIDKMKKEKLQLMRQDTQSFLFQQMAEKENRKQETEKLKDLHSAVYKADGDEYRMMEEEKVKNRQQRNMENRQELEKQIEARKASKKKQMSSSEISMNIDLINVVEKTLKERDQIMKQRKVEEAQRSHGDDDSC